MRWKSYPGGLLSPNIEDRRGVSPEEAQRQQERADREEEMSSDLETVPYYTPPYEDPNLQETAVSSQQSRLYELARSKE
jgi:hypothetical protein